MKYQLLIVIFLGLLLIPVGAWASAADITGTWVFTLNLDNGPQNVNLTFVFKQQGEKFTGTQSDGSGDQKVTGTVKGDKVSFSVEGKNRSGEPFKLDFTGKIDSATKMSGAAQFPKGPGKWSATKK